MAKLLVLNPNTDSIGRHSIPTTYISAALKREGHNVELFDTTFMDISYLISEIKDKPSHEQLNIDLNFFKKVNFNGYGSEKKHLDVSALLQAKIDEYKPDMIAFSFWGSHLYAEGEFWAYFHALKLLKDVNLNGAVVITGGTAPSWSPSEALEDNPCLDYVFKGEAEFVFVDVANAIDAGEPVEGIANVCFMKNGIYHENPLRPLIRPLDDLPIADYEIYDDRTFYRPYHGKMVRCIDAEASRGCIYKCTFCLSPFQRNTYGTSREEEGFPTTFRREKSVERILEEFECLVSKYKLDMIRFQDETFLTMKKAKLAELAPKFKERVNVPFIIEATLNSITKEKLEYLKEMGCVSMSLGLESGSEKLRNEVLLKPKISNKKAIENAKLVKKSGISFNLFNMIGFPHETKEMVMETIMMTKAINPPYSQISYFQPWEGTPLRDYAVENGMLNSDSKGLDNSADTLTVSNLTNLPMSKAETSWYHDTFSYHVYLNQIFWPLFSSLDKDGFNHKIVARFLFILMRISFFFRK